MGDTVVLGRGNYWGNQVRCLGVKTGYRRFASRLWVLSRCAHRTSDSTLSYGFGTHGSVVRVDMEVEENLVDLMKGEGKGKRGGGNFMMKNAGVKRKVMGGREDDLCQ